MAQQKIMFIAAVLLGFLTIFPAVHSQAFSGGVSPGGQQPVKGTWKKGQASFYGPGKFTGYCGRSFISQRHYVVAHQTLPCGSKVLFRRGPQQQVGIVVDRGPFVAGRQWDLSYALAAKLKLLKHGAGQVQYQVIRRGR